MKVEIGSLIVHVESLDELDQLVKRYSGSGVALPVHADSPVVHKRQLPPDASQFDVSPREQRLEELRDLHGPVHVLQRKDAPTPGQIVQHGDPPRKVEILEAVTQPGPDGKVMVGGFFGKIVEAAPS
jgi:hypothetical protein